MLITNVRAHHIRIPYDAGVASFRQGASSIAALEIVMVEVSTDAVEVDLLPTFVGCPAKDLIGEDVRRAVAGVAVAAGASRAD